MLQFDDLVTLGQEDFNELIKLLKQKMKEERLVFHGLETYVEVWLSSYVSMKEEKVPEVVCEEVPEDFMVM